MAPMVGQIGLPGTQELIVVLLLFVLFVAVPLGIVAFILLFLYRRYVGVDDERIEELERKVEELREERRTTTGEPDDSLE